MGPNINRRTVDNVKRADLRVLEVENLLVLPDFVVSENEAILTENHHECSQYASKKV